MGGDEPTSGGPLGGVRVVDTSPFLPGPFATQMLADLGAAVIKVEPPAGDPAGALAGGLRSVANRNKRSVVLDLKTGDGREALHALAARADVFVEGFRPSVAERLGASYPTLSEVNPSIVYCSLSGYGQSGAMRHAPGHDVNYLAESGFLSYGGSWAERRPSRPGVPVADLAGSSYAAVAILAALRERDRTGRGCHLDVSLADAATAFASSRAGAQLTNDGAERQHLLPTNDLFDTADGVIGIGAVEEHFWQRLRKVLASVEPGLSDPRFDTAQGRREHGDELAGLLCDLLITRPSQEWVALLSAADVPVSEVRSVAAAVREGPAAQRGIVQSAGGERHIVFPVVRDGRPMGRLRTVADETGASTGAVLEALAAGTDPWSRD